MIDYLEVLSEWLDQPHYLLAILILVYMVSATVDFLVGAANAFLTKEVVFSSKTLQLGVIRKLVTLIVMILVMPLAMMLPKEIGIYTLTVLYAGIAGAEVYSILAHVGIVKDGDKHKNLVATLFTQLIENVMQSTSKNK